MRYVSLLLVLALVPASAVAADCTMKQLQISSFSVIEPCTKQLAWAGLGDAERSQLHFVRGRGYHRTKRLDEAREDYEAAFKLNPKNADILVSWSNVDLRQGRGQDYMARIEQAYELDPKNPHVLRAVGGMLDNVGDTDKAMEFYTQALAISPSDPFALYFRSWAYKGQRKFKEAIADADRLVAIPRATLDAHGFLDNDGTLRDFLGEALIRRARIHEEAGQTELARRDFDAAVAAERSTSTLLARGWFLRDFPEDRSRSLEDLRAAAQLDPDDDGVQYALGLTLSAMKRFEHAIVAFDAATKANPHRGVYLIMRAYMHRELGRTDDAVRDFEEALVRDPREVKRSLPSLQRAGYWTSRDAPRDFTPEFRDAIRACMMDVRC